MKKPFSPLALLSMAFPEEIGMALNSTFLVKRAGEREPVKECLLPGCHKGREGNKLFCCREHFGEYQKAMKGKKNG